jgi:hypothetical protein
VRYRSSSVFRLGQWTAQFPTELACSVVLRIPPLLLRFTCTGLSPAPVGLPRPFHFCSVSLMRSYNPAVHVQRFGLLRFRSPLLAESSLFLGLLRCFSSPGSLRLRDDRVSTLPGFPIRTSPTVNGCTRLVGAFRSVPRPSSALDAKASPVCPYSLSLMIRRTRYSRRVLDFFSRYYRKVCNC